LCDIFILLAYIKISLYSLSLFLPKCLWDIYPHQSFIYPSITSRCVQRHVSPFDKRWIGPLQII
jgi:hypothetical protein